MNRPGKGCFIGLGVFVALVARPARATDGPLLVVVEAPPALDADAAEIRRAIGTELHSKTVAPMKTPTEASDRALIVALDRDRIAMSLRTSDAAPVARSIPAPPERAARLRAIAWLAGNLARDQVTPIVAEAPPEMPSLATIPPVAVAPNATEPPPIATSDPVSATEGAMTIATHGYPVELIHPPRWTIGVADGPYTAFPIENAASQYQSFHAQLLNPFRSGFWSGFYGSVWRLEVQRHTKDNGLFMGAALEGMAGDFTAQLIGAMAFVGSAKKLGLWRLEATIGAGLEAAVIYNVYSGGIVTQGSNGYPVMNETFSDEIRPGLYGAGSVAVAHPIVGSLDLVARLGLHMTTVMFNYSFFSETLGLRYNL